MESVIYFEKHYMETVFKPKTGEHNSFLSDITSFIRSEKLIQGYESLKCQIQGQITTFSNIQYDYGINVMLIIHKMHLLFSIQD